MVDLLKQQNEVTDIEGALPLVVDKGNIEIKNVRFSYTPEKQVLKNISFNIQAGKTIALVSFLF